MWHRNSVTESIVHREFQMSLWVNQVDGLEQDRRQRRLAPNPNTKFDNSVILFK